MNELLILLSWPVMVVSLFFFATGSLGLLRFPDAACRLHAVTKADTVGLGFLVLAMALRADDWQARILLLAVWLLAMASGATTCQLLARYSRDHQGNSFNYSGDTPIKSTPIKNTSSKLTPSKKGTTDNDD